jgi:tripartite-type tricarboxylate transporter receptor subunit TctC
MKRIISGIVAMLALSSPASVTSALAAEDFPNRPIRFIVPFPPGGGTDVVARTIAQKLSENMGQPVVIDNKPGGSGMIATDFVVKSKPDGYTILIDNSASVMNPALYPNIPYDVQRDLAPVTLAATVDNLLLVNPSVPARNVAELIALAKAQPGALTYASTGNGGPQHIGMEMFKSMAGVDIRHIPYKGGAPATLAVVAGEVQMQFISTTTALPQVKAGKLRALGSSDTKRSKAFPDVPTLSEAGLNGYLNVSWFGIFAPAKTPAPIIARLNAEFAKALNSPAVQEKLAEQGIEAVGSSPQTLAEVVKDDLARYGKVIRDANIKVD